MKYQVKIIETLSRIVEVEASNPDEAWDKVEAQYKKGEIVLDDTDFDGYEIYGCGESKD
ncbi:MAG: DpnD/PcfM family protein [Bacteroidaceae bacterium]|nr:DpnD/PcfM family protein [Bacteroidaceae bacterium]